MDNLDKILQEIEQTYREKVGDNDLPLDQVAHLVMHLVVSIYKRESPDGSMVKES